MWTPRLGLALLLAFTAAVYAPVMDFPYVYEDWNDIQALTKPFQVSDLWTKPARSLTAVSVAVSNARTPLTARAFHADNVLLHLVNIGLVFALASSAVPQWPALFGAALFALHPLQVESVAYISSRADLVATACVLLALLALERRRWLGVIGASVLAVLGKETAIVVGLLVPLWAWYRGIPIPGWVRVGGLTGASLAVGYLLVRYPVHLDPLLIGSQLQSMTYLVGLAVVPYGLTIDHDWQWSQPMQIAGLLGLVGVPAVVGAWGRHPISVLALWSLAVVAPRLFVPLVEGLHEHHLMMVMPAIALVFAWLMTPKGSYGLSPAPAPA